MKKIYICLFSLLIFSHVKAQNDQPIRAGMNKVKLEFMLGGEGKPVYAVYYGDKAIIKPSAMGFTLANDSAFDKHFIVTGSEHTSVDETWKPVWGEVSSIRNHYEQVIVHLKQKN